MIGKHLGLLVTLCLASSCANPATTKNLKEIFIGRCHEFFNIISPGTTPKNCTLLWETFHAAFAYKSGCHVQPDDYSQFFNYADENKLLNKTLFWEATKDTVEILTRINPSFVSLGNTLQGYIANNLVWCGGNSSDGINHTNCPTQKDCGFEVYYPYWAFASKQLLKLLANYPSPDLPCPSILQFAEKVQGIVYVLLNGSRTDGVPTYSRDSYFAKLELPFMNNKTVKRLKVWVIYDLNKEQKEKCGHNSLKDLQEDAKKFGLQMTCENNPGELRPLLCSKYPDAKVCESHKGVVSSAAKGQLYKSFWILATLLKNKENTNFSFHPPDFLCVFQIFEPGLSHVPLLSISLHVNQTWMVPPDRTTSFWCSCDPERSEDIDMCIGL
eukprot:gene7253-8061_t